MTCVLAFDIAYHSGWAVTKPDGTARFGHFKVDAEGGNIGRAICHFSRQLEVLRTNHPVSHIAWEMPIQSRHHNARFDDFVKGVQGLLHLRCFERYMVPMPLAQNSVRKHFIGDGRPSKAAKQTVFDHCRMLGYLVQDTDESDAIAVWDYAHALIKLLEVKARAKG